MTERVVQPGRGEAVQCRFAQYQKQDRHHRDDDRQERGQRRLSLIRITRCPIQACSETKTPTTSSFTNIHRVKAPARKISAVPAVMAMMAAGVTK